MLLQRLKSVHHVPSLVFTVAKMTRGQQADYGGRRTKHVSEVSVKNVVSLWGRAANFSANPISTGGLLGIWLPKPTWDWSYLFLLWLYAARTEAQTHMTHDLWTLTTRTAVWGCVRLCAYICGCLLSASGWYRANSFRSIWMCWQDQGCRTRGRLTEWSEDETSRGTETAQQ